MMDWRCLPLVFLNTSKTLTMVEFKSYRNLSKVDYGRKFAEQEKPDHDDLRLGALLRIADATEIMAKRYNDLIQEVESLKRTVDYWRRSHASLQKTNSNLRGQITKLKKAANRL